MTLCDVNVLVNALVEKAPHHASAREAIHQIRSGDDALGWHPMLGASAVRIVTSPRIFPKRCSMDECRRFFSSFLGFVRVERCFEQAGFEQEFFSLLQVTGWGGSMVSDAYWATLALQHSATWVTFDRDFLQVPNLKLQLLP